MANGFGESTGTKTGAPSLSVPDVKGEGACGVLSSVILCRTFRLFSTLGVKLFATATLPVNSPTSRAELPGVFLRRLTVGAGLFFELFGGSDTLHVAKKGPSCFLVQIIFVSVFIRKDLRAPSPQPVLCVPLNCVTVISGARNSSKAALHMPAGSPEIS